MRTAQLISVFSGVSYERAYYAGCQCKRGKVPLDEQFGLEPGAVTAGLAALLALAGIEFSYDQSPKWLQAYLLFDVAENTVRCAGFMIGSGSLESACKQIVPQRLKLPGAQWIVAGAV